jgi:hypothetical protein
VNSSRAISSINTQKFPTFRRHSATNIRLSNVTEGLVIYWLRTLLSCWQLLVCTRAASYIELCSAPAIFCYAVPHNHYTLLPENISFHFVLQLLFSLHFFFLPIDGSSIFLRNIGIYLQIHTALEQAYYPQDKHRRVILLKYNVLHIS